MTFADLLAGESVFLDANTLIYHLGEDLAGMTWVVTDSVC